MSGLSYHRIVTDGLKDAVRKKPFKPSTSFKDDPVPAVSPQSSGDVNYKYRPGHYAPDPVPASPAKASDVEAFKPLYTEADGSFAGPDPVPAASYYQGE
jgi:hypothetical protein